MQRQLYHHIDPFLPAEQSGFRPGDGTVPQLTRLIHHVSGHLDNSQCVLGCFFDLSKAFDRVWHSGLLTKLKHYGVHNQALAWLTEYLTGRRQRVRVGTSFSSWEVVPAGVPQGSVLGPLLFLAYTVDLPAACSTSTVLCSQFADDTALIVNHRLKSSAISALQSSIVSAANWLKAWHLLVNPTKTVTMQFSGRADQTCPQVEQLPLSLDGNTLSTVNRHRHLGVTIQSNLHWNNHITEICTKASSKLHLLRRLRHCLTRGASSIIYTSYIRPILEYASCLLSSLPTTHSDRLERFQRKAARVCLGWPLFTPVNHTHLLSKVAWPTLSSRRRLSITMLGHSLHYGYAPAHLLAVAPSHSVTSSMELRRPRSFVVPTTRTSRHRDSPVNLACTYLNQLPSDLVLTKSKDSFKSQLQPFIISSVCSCSEHPSVIF